MTGDLPSRRAAASYGAGMTWIPLVSTLLGAVIATASALLVETRRTRREEQSEWRTARRALYAAFLGTHAQARSDLRDIAYDADIPSGDRPRLARSAFAPCYGTRYEMEILAPPSVVEPAVRFSRATRLLRDAVGSGAVAGGPEYRELTDRYLDAVNEVRDAMRGDVGADGVAG
ncbi:hypothetical protein T261_7152 [Streptomyces lydicus]|nr:hypothetical protein T261_7152 [Streptomyces lydicus]